jgi:hypothetical protein
MDEGQGRDCSPDEERHSIHDDDMEDSTTDPPDLWMTEGNDYDTMFERPLTDVIPRPVGLRFGSQVRGVSDTHRSGQVSGQVRLNLLRCEPC